MCPSDIKVVLEGKHFCLCVKFVCVGELGRGCDDSECVVECNVNFSARERV